MQWDPDNESDAHPPLEPVDHWVVCACGNAIRPCDCDLSLTNHRMGVDEEQCEDCEAANG
jgi:hypothetical protein